MGPKLSDKLKTRQGGNKCDACGRTFINIAALKTHYKFNHAEDANKTVLKPNLLKKKMIVVTKKDESLTTDSDNSQKESEVLPPKAATMRRIEFECPVCNKVFPIYFPAHRHIQKHHCVDINGAEVNPNSPDLVKPHCHEICELCRERVSPNEEHNCDNPKQMYRCLGCGAGFETLTAFEQHIKYAHAKGMQSLYFSSPHACSSWRKQTETATGITYIPLKKTKQLKSFRCPIQLTTKSGKTQLCPSFIIITETSTGYDINYYKQHYGHKMDSQIQVNEVEPSIEEKRNHFKKVMNDIISDSISVNDEMLKALMGKAVQMVVLLENYKKGSFSSKNINDDKISTELNSTKDVPTKRTGSVKFYPGAKKIKEETTNSSPNAMDVQQIANKRNARRQRSNTPTQNMNLEEKDVSNITIKKEVPDISINKEVQNIPIIKEVTTAQIEKELTLDKEKDNATFRTLLKSPPSFNDTYKSFVDETILKELDVPPRRAATRKKTIMKTKIGQFKPSLSPKSPVSSPISKPSTPVPQLTKFTKYEVKEQENDCNILILKF